MPNQKENKKPRQARAALTGASRSSRQWGTIVGALVIVLFAAGAFGYALFQDRSRDARHDALAAFTPSASNQDPSAQIPGVTVVRYQGGRHVEAKDQVAYTQSPPMGGTHDQNWAACTGVVYPTAVRAENLVHSMEHGAVWIAYDPARVSGENLSQLTRRFQGEPYTALSPYPGLDQPISLQSWGHQLKLSDVADPRIDQFLTALRGNQYTHPEVGASCQALGPGEFDQDRPPPYRPAPPISAVGQPGIQAEAATPAGSGS